MVLRAPLSVHAARPAALPWARASPSNKRWSKVGAEERKPRGKEQTGVTVLTLPAPCLGHF